MPQITQPQFSGGGAIGGGSSIVPQVFQAVLDPTANSDGVTIGARVGDTWVNTATGAQFTCLSAATGAARWRFYTMFWVSVAPSITHTGNTNETELARLALPAGLPGLHGLFEVYNSWLVNNDASGKTGSTKLGAAAAAVGSCTALRSAAIAGALTLHEIAQWKNQASASSQKAFGALSGGLSIGTASGAAPTAAINTAAAFDIVWTGTLTDGTDSITLNAWAVKLLRPDIA